MKKLFFWSMLLVLTGLTFDVNASGSHPYDENSKSLGTIAEGE